MAFTADIECTSYFPVPTSKGIEIVPCSEFSRTVSTPAESFANYVSGRINDADALVDIQEGWIGRLINPETYESTRYRAYDSEEQAWAQLTGEIVRQSQRQSKAQTEVAKKEVFKVHWEARGLTQDRSIVDAFISLSEAQAFTETSLAEGTLPSGVIGVVEGCISEDDGQSGKDVCIFICVTLLHEAESLSAAENLSPPENLLTKIADMMGADINGQAGVELEPHSWEIVNVEQAQDESIDTFRNAALRPKA